MAGIGLPDILSTIQNGVVAANNLVQQMKGTLTNISGQLAAIASSTIPSTYVVSFNGRSSAVLPAQGDYPTSLIPGTSTNNNATAGNVGEYISSVVPSTTPLVVTSGVISNLTSINISAGDWDISGSLGILPSSAMQGFVASISSVSAGFGDVEFLVSLQSSSPVGFQTGGRMSFPLATRRYSIATSTTIYAVSLMNFGSSATIYGALDARRVR